MRAIPAFFRPDWTKFHAGKATLYLIALGVVLGAGFAFGQPGAGVVASSGALVVGYGAGQSFSHWRPAPMVISAVGMGACAALGSLLGHSLPELCVASGLFAVLTAYASILGPGAWWIVLQCAITLFISGAFPDGLRGALERGELVLAGGAVQLAVVSLAWRLDPRPWKPEHPNVREAWRKVVTDRSWRGETELYVACAAVAVVLATVIAHAFGLANAYWAPMTALLVLKPQWQDTGARTAARVVGTFVGATVAGAAAVWLAPNTGLAAVGALAAAWASYALLDVNYAFFTAALTAYVIYLLALANTPEAEVAFHRVVATLIGAGLAFGVNALLRKLLFRGAGRRASV